MDAQNELESNSLIFICSFTELVSFKYRSFEAVSSLQCAVDSKKKSAKLRIPEYFKSFLLKYDIFYFPLVVKN